MNKKKSLEKPYVHPTAIVEEGVLLSPGVKIWHFCHLRKGARLAEGVSLGRDVYVENKVRIGRFTRIQNGVSIYNGLILQDHVFVGPHVIFTNDPYPRADKKNWKVVPTLLETGCAVGAGSIIRCGVNIGAFSMVGAGSVVTRNVPPFTLMLGLPARPTRKVCACGDKQWPLNTKLKTPYCKKCKKNMSEKMFKLAHAHFLKINNHRQILKIKK